MSDLSTFTALHGTFVVSNEEFWSRLSSECADESIFDGQGVEHERIDLRLVDKIHALLVPILGEPDGSVDWWHNLDCYGDGIRSVSLNLQVLEPRYLREFQGFLSGEHDLFCILVQVHEDLDSDSDKKIGCFAIFSQKVMVTRGIAQRLAIAT